MHVTQHIVLGFLFATLIFLFFPQIGILGTATIFLSSFLIDIDHYIYYIFKKKDINLKKAHNYWSNRLKKYLQLPREKRNQVKTTVFFFHGSESLILLLILSYFSKYFFFIFLGFFFHIFLDVLFQRTFQDKWDRLSMIHDIFKSKKLINQEDVK